MTVTAYKWTINRDHQAIEAGLFTDEPVELLQGDIVLMPPERDPHAYFNSEVGDYLRSRLGNRAKVRDAKPITLPNQSEPVPDLAIAKPLGEVYLQHHPYPSDLYWVIEFSNATLTKDLNEKREVYATADIREYWVVNLQERQLHIFCDLKEGQYTTATILTTGSISPQSFPDLQIPLQQLYP